MNLTERAEIRKETFYKLTNSADVPEAPSGNRNLYALSKNSPIWSNEISNLVQNVATGEISFKVTGRDPFFGTQANKNEAFGYRGVKIPVKTGQDIAVQLTNELFIKNYVSYFGDDDKAVKNFKGYQANKFVIPASELEGVSYVAFRFGIKEDTQEVGSVHSTKVKVEYGNVYTDWSPAPEDLGWSMDTLVPTQKQRYLWKFEYIYYSDGSVEITQPTNISIAGADGTNGQTSHVHFAFADNATGGGFSLTTPKAYMGWYADFNETASNDPTKYKWGKWKGDQGVRGDKGDDGKTSYLHLAFASSADGKTGFSFTESGQQYQGYYTDFVQTSSTDPTKYTWMDRRAGVEVGGVNLLHNSKGPFQPKTGKIDNYVTYSNTWINMEKGKEYTLSAKGTAPFTNIHSTDKEKNDICLWLVKHDENINVDRIISSSSTGNDGTKFTWNDPSGKYYLRVNTYKIDNSNYAEDVQIEEGNVKTTYTRNPEDVQADIDSKADQALTQQQLNALAEQNSIVKAEMEAKASIDTVNQWITAYQNYVNANDEAKAESERNLQEASARILQLKTDVGTLRQQWDFIDTYMTVQNEGLIIGKSDGSAYAKFANDRISLFSGSSEVMYISQGVLRIENGIFTKTIQIGWFRFETHPADQDMLVLRYLGG